MSCIIRGRTSIRRINRHILLVRCHFAFSTLENMPPENHPKNFLWLGTVAPQFSLRGDQVSVIATPSDFYRRLLQQTQLAIKRITWASLYLGTGTLEKELVNALDERLEKSAGNLKVSVLLDFARSSRGLNISSRSLLLPLLKKYEQSCSVALYHSPCLRGPLKWLLPQRWNEIIGLQHMKIYIFDNSVIISGANLSNDYFTNRQDRYILIEECEELANFLDGLVDKVSDFSFKLTSENELKLSSAWTGKEHPYLGDKTRFIKAARQHVWDFYSSYVQKVRKLRDKLNTSGHDTWIYPLIEMGQLRIKHDTVTTKRIIESAPADAKIDISTGYFNLTRHYSQSIVHKSYANFKILMAHPNANGFLGASFPAGGIPAAYTLIAHRFLLLLRAANADKRITLWEYQHPNWTFHAKGMWYTLPGHQKPSLTLVGSPNFGQRSEQRDLELQIAMVSNNSKLQSKLGEEVGELVAKTSPFPQDVYKDSERRPPLWVHLVVAFFRNFF